MYDPTPPSASLQAIHNQPLMASKKMLIMLLQVLMLAGLRQAAPLPEPRKIGGLFREYIGAESNGVKFTDVPINYPNVKFDFILAFAADYTADGSSSTNGHFRVFWDSNTLSPEQVSTIKQRKSNVRVALSLGGDSIGSSRVFFNPLSSVASWVTNAVSSLTPIIKQYHLDGIDIDYEHFKADPYTFAECIGELVKTLKNEGVISFASIAPFNDDQAQKNYLALWNKYSSFIDYVDFQFYTYNSGTTIAQFLGYFEEQSANYHGGRVLASFGTGSSSGGLSPRNGFFDACQKLKEQGKLNGIVAWSADESVKNGFRYETIAQQLLAE